MKKFPILQRLKEITTKIGNVGNTDLQTQVTTLKSNLNGLIKTQTFTAHVDETWGTIPLPSGITSDRVLFCYATGTYGYMSLTCRGDSNMFCWYFDQNGNPKVLKNADVSGVIVYR